MALLTGLKNKNKISWSQYRDQYPMSNLVSWLYSSPKNHKPVNPLYYTGSLAYAMSKAIAYLLKPLVGTNLTT